MTVAGKKKIVFRTDNTSNIEVRHFGRALSLAQVLNNDFDCVFALTSPTQQQREALANAGIALHELSEPPNRFEQLLSLVNGDEIIVIDNCSFTHEHQKQAKLKGCKVVCIDDFAKQHFACDAVINCNAGFSKSDYSAEPYTLIYTLSENGCMVKDASSAEGLTLEPLRKVFVSLALSMTTGLRRATADDIMLVFGWINDEEVRKQSYHQEFITIDQHKVWFDAIVNNRDEYYYIFEVDGKPAGQMRFDLKGTGLMMHNLVARDFRGRGLNVVLMRTAIERVLNDARVGITDLYGYIKTANVGSWEVFRNLPFKRELSTEYPDSYKVFYNFNQPQKLTPRQEKARAETQTIE